MKKQVLNFFAWVASLFKKRKQNVVVVELKTTNVEMKSFEPENDNVQKMPESRISKAIRELERARFVLKNMNIHKADILYITSKKPAGEILNMSEDEIRLLERESMRKRLQYEPIHDVSKVDAKPDVPVSPKEESKPEYDNLSENRSKNVLTKNDKTYTLTNKQLLIYQFISAECALNPQGVKGNEIASYVANQRYKNRLSEYEFQKLPKWMFQASAINKTMIGLLKMGLVKKSKLGFYFIRK